MTRLLSLRPGPVLGLACLLAACSSAAPTPSPTGAEPTPPSSAPATAGGELEPEVTEFTVAAPPFGLSSLGIIAALDELNSRGFTIDYPEVPQTNLIVQGVASGEFAFSNGATAGALAAIQTGAPLKVIGNRVNNEWTVTTVSSITQCEDLAGMRYAHHSESSTSTIMAQVWLSDACPDVQPEELYIAGSAERANALRAGQIDAAELEFSDAALLRITEGDRFGILTSFAETLPDLKPTVIYGNADFMAQNPNTTAIVLQATLEQYERISSDPAYLAELARTYLSSVDEETIDQVAEQSVELGLFEVDLTPQAMEGTIEFFTEANLIDPGMTIEDALDLSYLEVAKGLAGN